MVSELIDKYSGKLAVVEYHVWDSHATTWAADRASGLYGNLPGGVPWLSYDGLGYIWPIEDYEARFLTNQQVASSATMAVGAEHMGEDDYLITLRVCAEEESPILDMDLYITIVEDDFPADPSYSRNTFRQALEVETIRLFSGECFTMDRLISLKSHWEFSELRIIGWAQKPAPVYPAEVHQAAQMDWPFTGLPPYGDYDNDGDVDLDDVEDFFGCMTGPDPDTIPTGWCSDAFDVDEDGALDLFDYAAVQMEFTTVD